MGKDIVRKEQVQSMREFMVSRKVPSELQAKVRCYLETQAEMRKGYGDSEVLNLLSNSLRNEVTEYLNNRVISKHPFFEKLPHLAMRRINLAAMPSMYLPGDVVVEKGHMDTHRSNTVSTVIPSEVLCVQKRNV